MWETVEEAPLVDVLDMEDDVAIPAAAGGSDNILVEGEGDEDDDSDEVDGSADGAHALGEQGPRGFAHVAAAEAGGDEARAQPADHGVAEGEGQEREGEGGNERLAIAMEGVCNDGNGGAREGEEGEGLGARERGLDRSRHGGRWWWSSGSVRTEEATRRAVEEGAW